MQNRIVGCVCLAFAAIAALPYVPDYTAIWVVLTFFIASAFATVLFPTIRLLKSTRVVRNTAVVASIMILVCWAVSTVAYVRLPYAPKRAIAIGQGNFFHFKGVSVAGGPLTFGVGWLPTADFFGDWGSLTAKWGNGTSAYSSYIPIWPSALALLIATAAFLRFVPKRYPEGQCKNCGYSLKGNVSGACPECGKATAK